MFQETAASLTQEVDLDGDSQVSGSIPTWENSVIRCMVGM